MYKNLRYFFFLVLCCELTTSMKEFLPFSSLYSNFSFSEIFFSVSFYCKASWANDSRGNRGNRLCVENFQNFLNSIRWRRMFDIRKKNNNIKKCGEKISNSFFRVLIKLILDHLTNLTRVEMVSNTWRELDGGGLATTLSNFFYELEI